MMKELLPCLLFSYCIFTDFLAPHDSTLFFAYYNSYWVKITKKSHFQLFLEGELKFVNLNVNKLSRYFLEKISNSWNHKMKFFKSKQTFTNFSSFVLLIFVNFDYFCHENYLHFEFSRQKLTFQFYQFWQFWKIGKMKFCNWLNFRAKNQHIIQLLKFKFLT